MKQQKKLNIFILVLFIISCPFLTMLLSARYTDTYALISSVLSFIVSIIIGFKYIVKIEYNKKTLIISSLIALYVGKILSEFNDKNIAAILYLPALCIFVYIFIAKILPKIKNEYIELTNLEKIYIIITAVAAIIITCVMGLFSNAFYTTYFRNRYISYNVIYTTDTGDLVSKDAFCDINNHQNDIRQPMFGVFALPFGILAHLFSDVLFFLPNNIDYGMMLSIIQIILLAIIVIMLTKILKVDEKSKILFYLMFLVSAPYLVYSLCVEQYVIALFYLILTIYIYTCKKVEVNYSYIGAVGTLLTSGIIFPMTTNVKGIKNYIINTFKCFLAFLAVLIISGQLPQFIVGTKISSLVQAWSGGVTFTDKLYQFTNFLKCTLFFPESYVTVDRIFYAYRAVEPTTINIMGIIVFTLVVLSFILNHKEKVARICILWVMFSVVILLGIGWGAVENGMFLYILYFFWAYLCLIYMLIKKICKNIKHTNITMISLIIIMAIYNIPNFVKLISFAVEHY